MIYEEMYRYLIKNVSSTEFDVCLYSLLKVDWDGFIRATPVEIARNIGSTKKYVSYTIKKLSSSRRKNVLTPVESREGLLYRFNVGKTSLQFDSRTDKYCKKYSFFYTKGFRELPINAKRLLLMGAFRMSVRKNEEVIINLEEIIPTKYNDNNIPFTRQRLVEAICVINQSSLKDTVNIGLATNRITNKEMVHFSFAENTLNEFKENNAERELLKRKLMDGGYYKLLPEEAYIEIEKVGKYIYNLMMAKEKEIAEEKGSLVGIRDELLKLARFVYDNSVEKLAGSLISKGGEVSEPKQLSAYFSSIVHDVVVKEMTKYGQQANHIDFLMEIERARDIENGVKRELGYYDYNDPVHTKKRFVYRIYSILKEWSTKWIASRIRQIVDDAEVCAKFKNKREKVMERRGWKNHLDIIKNIKETKENAINGYEAVKNILATVRNKSLSIKEQTRFLDELKDSLGEFFEIQFERLKKFTQIIEMESTGK